MNDIISTILKFILEPEFVGVLYYVRLFFLIISFILMTGILFLIPRVSWFKYRFGDNMTEFLTSRPLQANEVTKNWSKVIEKFDKGTEGDYKIAVIEADNMLFEVMDKLGINGESFSEKLNNASPEKLKNIEEVKNAHKIRNNIVYDPDYKINKEEIKNTIDIYRSAFQNLDIF